MASVFAAKVGSDDEDDTEAWGVDGDIMVDEDGNLDLDEGELLGGGANGEEGWEVEDVAMPLGEEGAADEEEENFYAVPQRGHPPPFYWPTNSSLVADHVIGGSFASAARLLNRQLGIVTVKPFKQIFLSLYAR